MQDKRVAEINHRVSMCGSPEPPACLSTLAMHSFQRHIKESDEDIKVAEMRGGNSSLSEAEDFDFVISQARSQFIRPQYRMPVRTPTQ
jgi:hypothetical protein